MRRFQVAWLRRRTSRARSWTFTSPRRPFFNLLRIVTKVQVRLKPFNASRILSDVRPSQRGGGCFLKAPEPALSTAKAASIILSVEVPTTLFDRIIDAALAVLN